LFGATAKTTSSAIKSVADSSAILPLVTAQTVGSGRGVGGCTSRGRTHSRQPQAARRRTQNSARHLVVARSTSNNWSRHWKDGKQRWLGLGSVKDVSLSAQSQREQCQLLELCSAGLDRRPSALLREHIVETQQTLRPASGALRGMSARAVELICQYGACACAAAPTSALYR
jgi:hypothetical protein